MNKYTLVSILVILVFVLSLFIIILSVVTEPAKLCRSNNWESNVIWRTPSLFGYKNNTIVCKEFYANGGKQLLLVEDSLKFGNCYRTGNCLGIGAMVEGDFGRLE